MSYDIIKSITIVKDKVYITSAASNVRPRTFERWESGYFSSLYQVGGYEMLLKALAADVWQGNFHLLKGSQLCRNLHAGFEVLLYDRKLRNFLDSDHAAQYMADFVLNIMGKGPFPDIQKLYALRQDKASVLAVCKKRPDAFDHAAEDIRKDRETAKAYILENRHQTMFSMPTYFRGDKELAMLALEKNGTIYRRLDPALQADRDIVRFAFNSSYPRRFFEHLPDIIPEALREDKPFMRELVTICPQLHMFRTPELLEDKAFLIAWLGTGKWSPYALKDVPNKFLNDPGIQALIRSSIDKPDTLKRAEAILADKGISLSKPSIDSLMRAAETKAAGPRSLKHSKEHEAGR